MGTIPFRTITFLVLHSLPADDEIMSWRITTSWIQEALQKGDKSIFALCPFRSAVSWSSTWAATWRSIRSSLTTRCCWSWARWTRRRSSSTTSTWWGGFFVSWFLVFLLLSVQTVHFFNGRQVFLSNVTFVVCIPEGLRMECFQPGGAAWLWVSVFRKTNKQLE